MSQSNINWHSTAFSVLQIELSHHNDILHFHHEFAIPCNPNRLDYVIMNDSNAPIPDVDLGRIFRKYNLFSYKGPGDSLNQDAYYQALSYTYGFPSTQSDAVLLENITLTLMTHDYPRKLLSFMDSSPVHPIHKNIKKPVAKVNSGIYNIYTDIFPIQLIVTTRLSPEDHPLLRSVTNHLSDDIPYARIVDEYSKHNTDQNYQNFLNTFIRANYNSKGDILRMCDALYELFADDLMKARNEGEKQGFSNGEKQGFTNGEKYTSAILNKLTFLLLAQNRIDDLRRSSIDPTFQRQLLAELHII